MKVGGGSVGDSVERLSWGEYGLTRVNCPHPHLPILGRRSLLRAAVACSEACRNRGRGAGDLSTIAQNP